jgi:hypothetical protein
MFAVAFLVSSAEYSDEDTGLAVGEDSLACDEEADEVVEVVLELLPPVAPPMTPRTKSPIGITKRFFLNQGFGAVLPVNGRSVDIIFLSLTGKTLQRQ